MSSSGGGGRTAAGSMVLVDYHTYDFRGFVFVVHEQYGLLLLHCTRKVDKPPHWQLPGGHVDEAEFLRAAETYHDEESQLIMAARMGAARELFEETGIDVRSQLDRLDPAPVRAASHEAELKTNDSFKGRLLQNTGGRVSLTNEYKSRLFFFLQVTDADFPQRGNTGAMGETGKHVKLKLSFEHSGFLFQPEPAESAEMLKYHSSGKVSDALLMAMQLKAPDEARKVDTQAIYKRRSTSPPQQLPAAVAAGLTRRRSKYNRDGTNESDGAPRDVAPPPKKKGLFSWCR